MLKMADVFAGGREDFDEAKTVTGDVIVAGGVLLGVSDEQDSADILNVEWREPARNSFSITPVIAIAVSFERIVAEVYGFEICVIDFHAALAEIGEIQETVAVDLAARRAFVDGAIGTAFF